MSLRTRIRSRAGVLLALALMLCLGVFALSGCQAPASSATSSVSDESASAEASNEGSATEDEAPARVSIATTLETSGPIAELASLYALDHPDIVIDQQLWDGAGALPLPTDSDPAPTVIIASSPASMTALSEQGLVDTNTVYDLARDPMVIVTASDGPILSCDIEELLSGRHTIALAPDDTVMGVAARQCLAHFGAYSKPEGADGMLAGAIASLSVTTVEPDVSAVFSAVADGKRQLGLVTLSDVYAYGGVRVVGYLPQDSYEAIYYPVAIAALSEDQQDDKTAAWDFLRWTANDLEADRIWGKWGLAEAA